MEKALISALIGPSNMEAGSPLPNKEQIIRMGQVGNVQKSIY